MSAHHFPSFLSQCARTALTARGWARVEAFRAYRADELAELLTRAGLPTFQQLFAMEEEIGGLADFGQSGEPDQVLVGPFAMQEKGFFRPLRSPTGATLVPIARTIPFEALAGLSNWLYVKKGNRIAMVAPQLCALDTHGQVFREGDGVELFASSYRTWVGKLALFAEMGLSPRAVLRVRPRGAEHLVRLFDAVEIDEASDDVHRFWRVAGAIIEEGPQETRVWATEASVLVRAVAALANDPGVQGELALTKPDCETALPCDASDTAIFKSGAPRLPLGFDENARSGVVLVDGSQRVHRIRTFGSRILEWDSAEGAEEGDSSQQTLKLSRRSFSLAIEDLAPYLSPRCLEWMQTHNVTRDPEGLLPRAKLERALVDRGLPVLEPALHFEELAGGLWLPGGSGKRHALGVTLSLAAEIPGPGLVPIGATSSPGSYWMDARGHILVDDYVEDLTFVAASWRILLERMAMGHDYFNIAPPEGRYGLWISENRAEQLAAALDVRLLGELSDEYEGYWEAEGMMIWRPPRFRRFRGGTVVSADRVGRLVEAIRTTHAISTSALFYVFRGESTSGTQSNGSTGTERYPLDASWEPTGGEILVRGEAWVEQHVSGNKVEVFVDEEEER